MKMTCCRVLAGAGVLLGLATSAGAQTPVQWSLARPVDGRLAPEQAIEVRAIAEIDTGWYIYAMTQSPGGPLPLEIVLPPGSPFAVAGKISAPAPQKKFDENFKMETATHHARAEFTIPVRTVAEVPAGPASLRVSVTYQACNDRLCLPPQEELLSTELQLAGRNLSSAETNVRSAQANATAGAPATNPADVTGSAAPARAAELAGSAELKFRPTGARAPVPDLALSSQSSTFGAYLGLAVAMGALSLLTPCVFPMVPITVSYFTSKRTMAPETASARTTSPVVLALVYGAGIAATFTLVGFTTALVFGAAGLNQFAANPWLNLGIAALFVIFALSLFGAYEMRLPSSWLTAVSRWDSGHGRYAGTLLMGLAFTLTSFTCTAPFLGTLLVVAAQGDWQWPLAGMLAFSTVFAMPFVVLALAPQLLSRLPRSGMWLIAVKASMGVLELAAAMKFLSNVDLVWGWGLFTREVLLVVWIALAVWLAAYLGGLVGLGRVPRLSRPGAPRWVLTAASVGVAVWLASGIAGRRLGELEAFLPPADLAARTPDGELPWIVNDYDGVLAQAARTQRPVLIDFTGYTCTNCRWMEANMFPRPEVARELARFERVRLYTDGRGDLYRGFQKMQATVFGTVALPYYAILDPGGQPRVGFSGLTRNPDEFIAFLRRGLE